MTAIETAEDIEVFATLARLSEQAGVARTNLTRASIDRPAAPLNAAPLTGRRLNEHRSNEHRSNEHQVPSSPSAAAEQVLGADAVAERIGAALARAHCDAVWIAPRTPAAPLAAIGPEHLPLRVLVSGPEGTDSAIAQLPVRVTPCLPAREVLVIDRATLLIPYRTRDGQPGLAVGTQPRTAVVLQSVFESLWRASIPAQRAKLVCRALDESVRREIVRQLADGSTDEMIARRLGISKRTCARHVAQILVCAGASSRFQAGVFLARFGDAGLGSVSWPKEGR